MGRPQQPLERDGSPVREFAFWLRDLRSRSGLTYEQLGRRAHYATSTVQEAAAGRRLPTLKVVLAFVRACDGDHEQWRGYWAQIRRVLDRDAPREAGASVAPPWAGGASARPPIALDVRGAGADDETGGHESADPARWYVESFTALLRLTGEVAEAVEQRRIVATVDGVSELETAISIPRHPGDNGSEHRLDVELLYGGLLESCEQPWESYFRNVIALPRPLRTGERHEYALRLRIPPGQPMASHYVHVPFQLSDYFKLRVRFDRARPPAAVWKLTGAPTAVIYERGPSSDVLMPDRFGEICVEFRALRLGLGYGLCWQEADA